MTRDRAGSPAADEQSDEPGYRQVGPVRIRRDASYGPIALVLISVIGVFAVLWGQLFADPGIEVTLFDAGRVDDHAIGKVVVFEDLALYVIGLEDGRIRAVDGRLDGTDCRVTYLPDDLRGRVKNPERIPGVLEDPCSEAVWAMTGDAISGTNRPLRTPQITFKRDDAGDLHVWVEIITLEVTTGE